MRKYLLLLLVFYFNLSFSQFATNFSCNDCNDNKHDLFNELDSGYIIVLDWVMPCISCIAPSKTAYNIIQSYSDSFPGKIRMYICDDLADTYCPSIVSWADNNGMPKTIKFSNNIIRMEDYGLPGMPKIVILGNKSHYVYFNEVDFEAGNITKIQTALNDAIAGKATNSKLDIEKEQIFLTYNFIERKHILNFKLDLPETFNIEIYDISGKRIFENILKIDNNVTQVDLNTEYFTQGLYSLKIFNQNIDIKLKLVINN